MKQHQYLLAFMAICLTACGPVYVIHQDPVPTPPSASPEPANPDDVTYQNFYDQLSPYGQWIEDPNYGYVWLPDAGADFKPYASNGHWVYTDEGWTWDSGYPWGWAAFHYGRWFFQDGYGWMWVPGTEWAPAWVSWRNSDEYYGWAPMGPNVSFDASYGGGYTPPLYYWSFVPHRYIASPQVNNYYVRETNNVTIINQTTVIRNTTVMNRPRNSRYGGGPDAGEVGRYSGSAVRPLVIRESHTPGERADNGNLTIYRPRVNGSDNNRPNNAGRPFVPSRTQTLNNARPVNRTVYGNNTGNSNGGRGLNQPANPQANPTNPAVNRPVPPGNQPNNQPDNRFGRPFQPNNQPNQQPQSAPNQPGRQQSVPNQQQSVPNRPSQQPSVPNRPNQQQSMPNRQLPVSNQPVQQRPVIGQPVQQRPVTGRPVNAMPGGRPFNPQQANPNQPRPVVNPPKPEPKPATPPPPPKKDNPGRPGRP
ncbi:MAG TPA: DUF6600 domain-containing protein [Puia sp.]|jgi:hypothetical protein